MGKEKRYPIATPMGKEKRTWLSDIAGF
jgi:hypothetical protein